MTRRLAVMRHAKSSWDAGVADDHARPLNDRGRRDAPRIADRLYGLGWTPQRVVSSDAARTVETWERMAARFPAPIEVLPTRRLYHAGGDAFAEVIGEQPDALHTLLVLGHNPGWEEVARRLSGLPIGLGTATAVLLQSDGDGRWADHLQRQWDLVDVLRPKEA
jgi:phosphohistidine phosphatase